MGDILFIFDMGGVVTSAIDVLPDIYHHLGISEEEFLTLAGVNIEKLTTGKISTDEFWNHFSELWGKKVEEELFGKFFHPRPIVGTVDLIKTIKTMQELFAALILVIRITIVTLCLTIMTYLMQCMHLTGLGAQNQAPIFIPTFLRWRGTNRGRQFLWMTRKKMLSERKMSV